MDIMANGKMIREGNFVKYLKKKIQINLILFRPTWTNRPSTDDVGTEILSTN